MPQTSIWIEDGCIQCFWCQNLDATVFEVSNHGCEIRAEVRVDGLTNANRKARGLLKRGVVTRETISFMRVIADGCPVQVIRIATTLAESPFS